jgi:tetratricopeptide (TPR) repeat protein
MKIFVAQILLITLISICNLYSQPEDFDFLVSLGMEQIYNIEFEEAKNTFQKISNHYPNHPAGRFGLAMIYWWKIILDTSYEGFDELFVQKMEDVIEFCDEILDKNPKNVDALFFKGGAIGFRGRLNVLRENWFNAAGDGKEALPLVEKAGNLDPSNTDVKLGFGIYNYYVSVIPENYPIVKPLLIFFPSGDKELGLRQLKTTATDGIYAKYEAQYFLMNLYYNFEKDMEMAEFYSNMLTESFPNNPVFQRWRGRIAVKRSDWVTADSLFKNILQKAELKKRGYKSLRIQREASYYIAYRYKSIGEFDSSLVYFQKCVDLSIKIYNEEESGFMINSTLYIGTIKEMQGKHIEAKMFYERVLEMREYGNSHTLAENYIDRIEQMNESRKN